MTRYGQYGHWSLNTAVTGTSWPLLPAVLHSRSRYFLVGAGVKVQLRLFITVDKTEEILNDILFVYSNID